jgi:hypothetical protein
MVDAQIANDPVGERWSVLLNRAINMFAHNVGITNERSRPHRVRPRRSHRLADHGGTVLTPKPHHRRGQVNG